MILAMVLGLRVPIAPYLPHSLYVAPIRYTSVAICPYVISIGYICCPSMPQSALCMALYIGVCNAGDAANGSVLRAIVGIMRAILAGIGR